MSEDEGKFFYSALQLLVDSADVYNPMIKDQCND
jgi:hypothetical protein